MSASASESTSASASASASAREKNRLQFDASSTMIAQLDELSRVFDTPTRAETVRKAILVLVRVARVMAEDGGEFSVVRKNGTLEKWVL